MQHTFITRNIDTGWLCLIYCACISYLTYSWDVFYFIIEGLYSLTSKMSYRMISWSLETAKVVFRPSQTLWNLTGTSTGALPRRLSNVKAIWSLWNLILQLRVVNWFGGMASYRFMNWGPWLQWCSYKIIPVLVKISWRVRVQPPSV